MSSESVASTFVERSRSLIWLLPILAVVELLALAWQSRARPPAQPWDSAGPSSAVPERAAGATR